MDSIKEQIEHLFRMQYPMCRVRYDIANRPIAAHTDGNVPTIAGTADLAKASHWLSHLYQLAQQSPDEFAEFLAAKLKKDDQQRKAEIDRFEQAQPFNQPQAFANAETFEYWAKMRSWTMDQALLLLFGRDPYQVSQEQIAQAVRKSTFATEYAKLRALVRNHVGVADGQLSDPISPGDFLRWAQNYNTPIPPHLLSAVQKYEVNRQGADRQKDAEIERWSVAYQAVRGQVHALNQKVKELEGELATRASMPIDENAGTAENVEPSSGERDKLLKHIGCLALLLAERNHRYQRGTKPSINKIANDVVELINEVPDIATRGAGKSSLRESIAEGIALLGK